MDLEQRAVPPAKRTGGRSARVRQAVLEAALQELTEKGYEHFNIPSVARRAGVHETSIYRRWGTRNALLIDAVSEVGHAPVPDTGSLRTDLCQLLSDSRTLMETPVGRTLAVLAIGAEPGEGGFYEPLKEFWQHRIAELEAIFARAAERGEWDAAVPARLRIDALLGAVVWRISITKDKVSDAQIAELVDLHCGPA